MYAMPTLAACSKTPAKSASADCAALYEYTSNLRSMEATKEIADTNDLLSINHNIVDWHHMPSKSTYAKRPTQTHIQWRNLKETAITHEHMQQNHNYNNNSHKNHNNNSNNNNSEFIKNHNQSSTAICCLNITDSNIKVCSNNNNNNNNNNNSSSNNNNCNIKTNINKNQNPSLHDFHICLNNFNEYPLLPTHRNNHNNNNNNNSLLAQPQPQPQPTTAAAALDTASTATCSTTSAIIATASPSKNNGDRFKKKSAANINAIACSSSCSSGAVALYTNQNNNNSNQTCQTNSNNCFNQTKSQENIARSQQDSSQTPQQLPAHKHANNDIQTESCRRHHKHYNYGKRRTYWKQNSNIGNIADADDSRNGALNINNNNNNNNTVNNNNNISNNSNTNNAEVNSQRNPPKQHLPTNPFAGPMVQTAVINLVSEGQKPKYMTKTTHRNNYAGNWKGERRAHKPDLVAVKTETRENLIKATITLEETAASTSALSTECSSKIGKSKFPQTTAIADAVTETAMVSSIVSAAVADATAKITDDIEQFVSELGACSFDESLVEQKFLTPRSYREQQDKQSSYSLNILHTLSTNASKKKNVANELEKESQILALCDNEEAEFVQHHSKHVSNADVNITENVNSGSSSEHSKHYGNSKNSNSSNGNSKSNSCKNTNSNNNSMGNAKGNSANSSSSNHNNSYAGIRPARNVTGSPTKNAYPSRYTAPNEYHSQVPPHLAVGSFMQKELFANNRENALYPQSMYEADQANYANQQRYTGYPPHYPHTFMPFNMPHQENYAMYYANSNQRSHYARNNYHGNANSNLANAQQQTTAHLAQHIGTMLTTTSPSNQNHAYPRNRNYAANNFQNQNSADNGNGCGSGTSGSSNNSANGNNRKNNARHKNMASKNNNSYQQKEEVQDKKATENISALVTANSTSANSVPLPKEQSNNYRKSNRNKNEMKQGIDADNAATKSHNFNANHRPNHNRYSNDYHFEANSAMQHQNNSNLTYINTNNAENSEDGSNAKYGKYAASQKNYSYNRNVVNPFNFPYNCNGVGAGGGVVASGSGGNGAGYYRNTSNNYYRQNNNNDMMPINAMNGHDCESNNSPSQSFGAFPFQGNKNFNIKPHGSSASSTATRNSTSRLPSPDDFMLENGYSTCCNPTSHYNSLAYNANTPCYQYLEDDFRSLAALTPSLPDVSIYYSMWHLYKSAGFTAGGSKTTPEKDPTASNRYYSEPATTFHIYAKQTDDSLSSSSSCSDLSHVQQKCSPRSDTGTQSEHNSDAEVEARAAQSSLFGFQLLPRQNPLSREDLFEIYAADHFLARSHLVEIKQTPPTLINQSKWDNLSLDIWKKFLEMQQTEKTFKSKLSLWRFLSAIIKNCYPRFTLYLVGSTISGFGSDASDVDMCLVSRCITNVDPRTEALVNLNILRDGLKKCGIFHSFNLIEAKVPILRFKSHERKHEVDLNFNNCVGIKNTHLLYCYSQMDWRLRPLVLVAKLWAQYHGINNAKNMTISSYSLVLMVIHYCQFGVNPPILPCLHNMYPEKFTLLKPNEFDFVDMHNSVDKYESRNFQTIGEIFLGFLDYFSRFDYNHMAISVRTGGILPINICRQAKSAKNDIHQWKELCIEEPFDLTNTARSVYDYSTFEHIKSVFAASYKILQESLDLNMIFADLGLPPIPVNPNLLAMQMLVNNGIHPGNDDRQTENSDETETTLSLKDAETISLTNIFDSNTTIFANPHTEDTKSNNGSARDLHNSDNISKCSSCTMFSS